MCPAPLCGQVRANLVQGYFELLNRQITMWFKKAMISFPGFREEVGRCSPEVINLRPAINEAIVAANPRISRFRFLLRRVSPKSRPYEKSVCDLGTSSYF